MARQKGIATLEMALGTLLLATVILSAVGMTDYLDQVRFVNETLESELKSAPIKPYRMGSEVLGEPAVVLNEDRLQGFLEALTQDVQSRMRSRSQRYFVEAKVWRAMIDPITGTYLGSPAGLDLSSSGGALAVSAERLGFTDLDRRFEQFAERTYNPETGNEVSLAATLKGIQTKDSAYLPESVMIGLRIFVSLESSLTGRALQTLGLEPVVDGYKIMQLRGVME